MEIKPKSLIISLCCLLLLLHSTTAVCVKRSHTYGMQELFLKTLTPSSQPITPAPAQSVTPPPSHPVTSPPAQSITLPPSHPVTTPPAQSVTPPAAEKVTPPPAKPVETQTFQSFIPPLVQTQGATLASSDDEFLRIVPGGNALTGIRIICARTDHPQVCMAAVPRTTHPDAVSVLMALIKSVQDKTHVAMEVAKKLSEKGTVPSIIAGNLDVCKENYADALNNLLKASNAIAARDVGTMNSMLSAALTDFSTCENGFGEMPGISPLKVYDDNLIELTSNCLAVAELIK